MNEEKQTGLLADSQRAERFINTLFPHLERDEAIFVSLSVRAKYLTEEQKDVYSIGRNEMFHRRWFYERENKPSPAQEILRYLQEISVERGALSHYTDKRGYPLPLSATMVYLNINPSDMRKAALTVGKDIFDMIDRGEGYHLLQSKLNTAMQKSRGTRRWTDIDIDLTQTAYDIPDYFKDTLPRPIVVQTHSGFHILVRNEDMKRNYTNLGEIIKHANVKFSSLVSEIKINSNAMIPLPGTYQGGTEVVWL